MPIKRLAHYRDTRGRFRKPTDEERWPDPRERERMLRIRGYFNVAWITQESLRATEERLRDINYISGAVWPESVRRSRHA